MNCLLKSSNWNILIYLIESFFEALHKQYSCTEWCKSWEKYWKMRKMNLGESKVTPLYIYIQWCNLTFWALAQSGRWKIEHRTRRYRRLLWNECFFFNVFINHLQKINKITIDLLYFWDVYDVNLWEKLAIMVKLRFIETRLKKGYDLWGYFLKIPRETINFLTIAVIHYFS